MIGSIIGDIVGSIYEFANIKTKEFDLFQERCGYTDDSILTLATADWLMNGGDSALYYLEYALKNPYPLGGYGTGFTQWVHMDILTRDIKNLLIILVYANVIVQGVGVNQPLFHLSVPP